MAALFQLLAIEPAVAALLLANTLFLKVIRKRYQQEAEATGTVETLQVADEAGQVAIRLAVSRGGAGRYAAVPCPAGRQGWIVDRFLFF